MLRRDLHIHLVTKICIIDVGHSVYWSREWFVLEKRFSDPAEDGWRDIWMTG